MANPRRRGKIMIMLICIAFSPKSCCSGILLRGEDNTPPEAEQVHTTQNGVFTDQRDANPISNINDIIRDIKTFKKEVNAWSIQNALNEKMNEIEPDSVERKGDVSKEEKQEEFLQAVGSLLSNENEEDLLRKRKSCRSSGECGKSLRCSYSWRSTGGGGTCTSLLGYGSWCKDGEDCASGYCGWNYKCSNKVTCQEDSDCKSRRCEHHAILNERVCADLGNNGEYCEQDKDCKSKFCDAEDKKCHAKRYKGQICSTDDDCGGVMTCSPQTNECLSFPRKHFESCEAGKKMCARGLECQVGQVMFPDDDEDEEHDDSDEDEDDDMGYFSSMLTINNTNSSNDNDAEIEDDDEYELEYECDNRLKKEGEVCTKDVECYYLLDCEDGKCVKSKDWGEVGDGCGGHDDCQTHLMCNNIGECELYTVGTNIATTYSEEKGDKCDDKFTFCESPLLCHISKKICVYTSKEQEEEAHTCYNSVCDNGYKCVDYNCVEKDIGDECLNDFECKKPLYCDHEEYVCTEPTES